MTIGVQAWLRVSARPPGAGYVRRMILPNPVLLAIRRWAAAA